MRTPKCSTSCQSHYNKEYARDKHFGSKFYWVSGERNMMMELYSNGPVEASLSIYEDFLYYQSGKLHNIYWSKLQGVTIIWPKVYTSMLLGGTLADTQWSCWVGAMKMAPTTGLQLTPGTLIGEMKVTSIQLVFFLTCNWMVRGKEVCSPHTNCVNGNLLSYNYVYVSYWSEMAYVQRQVVCLSEKQFGCYRGCHASQLQTCMA